MSWTQIDHTADIGLALAAASLEELLAEAGRGMCDSITDVSCVEPSVERSFELVAPDREELLVSWLEELLYVFETERFLPRRIDVELDGTTGEIGLAATVRGEEFDPERHPFKVQIKAVTYHELAVERSEAGWRGRVIFDI